MFKSTTEMINNFERALEAREKGIYTLEEEKLIRNYSIELAKALVEDLGSNASVVAEIIKAVVPKEDTYSKCYMCRGMDESGKTVKEITNYE